MASGRRSPMPKPFGPFGAGPPYARPAPPTRSFYAPCLPSKKALLPQLTADLDLPHPGNLTPQMSPLPTNHPANPILPPHPTGLETSPDSPLTPLPHLPDSSSPLPPPPLPHGHVPNTFPLREGAGPEGPTRVHCHFHCQI